MQSCHYRWSNFVVLKQYLLKTAPEHLTARDAASAEPAALSTARVGAQTINPMEMINRSGRK